jgi:hypothetical protein
MAPYNPPTVYRGYAEIRIVDRDSDFVFKMIGKKGRNFYDITEYLGIDYLWYNKDRHIIELWGNVTLDTCPKMLHLIECYKEIY